MEKLEKLKNEHGWKDGKVGQSWNWCFLFFYSRFIFKGIVPHTWTPWWNSYKYIATGEYSLLYNQPTMAFLGLYFWVKHEMLVWPNVETWTLPPLHWRFEISRVLWSRIVKNNSGKKKKQWKQNERWRWWRSSCLHDMNRVLKNWACNGTPLSSKLCLSHLLAVSGWEALVPRVSFLNPNQAAWPLKNGKMDDQLPRIPPNSSHHWIGKNPWCPRKDFPFNIGQSDEKCESSQKICLPWNITHFLYDDVTIYSKCPYI